jgi:hypothetical protein
MTENETVQYESLVENYEQSLTTVLRGFRPQLEFVDAWVPDEDAAKSLMNLVECAQIAGHHNLSVQVNRQTLHHLNQDFLKTEMKNFGDVKVTTNDAGAFIQFTIRPQTGGRTVDVTPRYKKNLEKFMDQKNHEGTLASAGDVFSFSQDGITLQACVDPANRRITKAVYSGTLTSVNRGLMEAFCDILIGLPIHEASQHAAIKLENDLRDSTFGRPVPGIVIPQNADPMFRLPLALIRGVGHEYEKGTGKKLAPSFYEPPVAKDWKSLSDEEKMTRAQEAIRQIGPSVQVFEGDVKITQIEKDIRIFMQYPAAMPSGEKGRRMMRLELELKKRLDPRIQVFMEEVKDMNEKRRL